MAGAGRAVVCCLLVLATLWPGNFGSDDIYDIGVGMADITGPAAGIHMMGYATPSQTTAGIHTRLWSRAFIVGDGERRVVFVSIDSAMAAQTVKQSVIKKLRDKYGDTYTEANVCISGTHTHSAPGGFLGYVIYLIPSWGFVYQSFDALVKGIVKSIEKAHVNIRKGRILYNEGELLETSINRSPTAYLNNPESERNRYKYNVDKTMHLLKLVDLDNTPIGMINWFAVHCTSMNDSNRLISSDNKGVASLLFEHRMNPTKLPGKGKFVAAFAQSNEGDVSPNILGGRCLDTGLPCDRMSSTCNGMNQLCVAFGPGRDQFESTRIIGQRQYKKAWELFESANDPLSGPIQYHQQYIDMSKVDVELADGKKVRTCKPALGYSFAAGTTDGPGISSFRQGTRSRDDTSAMWNIVRNFLRRPSVSQDRCHHPKPILLSTGEMHYPYEWQPTILDTQVFRIGKFVIAALPGEFTTMAGRRVRNVIAEEMRNLDAGSANPVVVIAGLANNYASYVTTPEEYQLQRYEGASTIYGPHTLDAYLQQYRNLTIKMLQGKLSSYGPKPPNMLEKQLSLVPGVIMDTAPSGKTFGTVISDVKSTYEPGSKVAASFVCGHPRNNMQLESSFMTVEKFDDVQKKWIIIATDANWETKFIWTRTSTMLGQSKCILLWEIPRGIRSGTYRMRHFGFNKSLVGEIHGYEGSTSRFEISRKSKSKKKRKK
uniref:Neutral ceramidase n=1 Tax=Hemiscolopendra marginata TaxID=943146 RepID=A0A646QJF6_9MYRI